MIVGVCEPLAALARRRLRFLRLHLYPSVEVLGASLLAGHCDWALVVHPDEVEVLAPLCQATPASGVLLGTAGSGTLQLTTRHAFVPPVPPSRALTWGGVRMLWRLAWARWVEAGLTEGARTVRGRFVPLFMAAQEATDVPQLARSLKRGERVLRAQLEAARLAPPSRWLLAGDVLGCWELVRLDRWSLEAIALALEWSSLSAIDRAVRKAFGLLPHELKGISSRDLRDLLVEGVQRRPLGSRKTTGSAEPA